MGPTQDNLLTDNHLNMPPTAHILLRLTYISAHNPNNANIELARILEQSRRNNELNGVTGALVMNENYFLQVIEGSRATINSLLQKLINDDRHFSLRVVECHEIEQRRWSKWSMKYLTVSNQHKEDVLKFSSSAEFNPYSMTASQIRFFIEALSEQKE
ncbi:MULTISPECIES: BLUF domain-containing protein [unclassified Psychrobacter]|uniref:BLUF domain-containing protein n=1 Tax=unclassified Psychrobacter TaxID=196806 RepID=UPI0025DD2673|nr:MULTISPECIES: BLUF domain-containing protein [unclassified Psychrobacter]